MKIKQYKNAKKNTFLKYKIIAVVFVALICLGLYGVNKASDYVAERELEIYQAGFEEGHLKGLEEGYNASGEDFYENLSTNPRVSYLFKKYFPIQEEARIMRAISLAESKGKQVVLNKNRNKSIDAGFFQVNTIHRKKGESKEQFIARMHNLEENFKEARRILDTQGLTAWVTYNTGAYVAFMK